MELMKQFSQKYMKEDVPEVNVGDTVRVHIRVKEGSRERIQVFEGTVIAKKHGGIEESFTVRRGKVRRAKLYYLRDRVGKAAKVKEDL